MQLRTRSLAAPFIPVDSKSLVKTDVLKQSKAKQSILTPLGQSYAALFCSENNISRSISNVRNFKYKSTDNIIQSVSGIER